jgi:integrase
MARGMGEAMRTKAMTMIKENIALLKEASEMFNETGCVSGIDITFDRFSLGYACGLYAGEAVRLKVKHIDSGQNTLVSRLQRIHEFPFRAGRVN